MADRAPIGRWKAYRSHVGMSAADKAHVAADADMSAPTAALPVVGGLTCPVGFWSADRPLSNTAPVYTI